MQTRPAPLAGAEAGLELVLASGLQVCRVFPVVRKSVSPPAQDEGDPLSDPALHSGLPR